MADKLNALFMAAVLAALMGNCNCKACERLRKMAMLMEQLAGGES